MYSLAINNREVVTGLITLQSALEHYRMLVNSGTRILSAKVLLNGKMIRNII